MWYIGAPLWIVPRPPKLTLLNCREGPTIEIELHCVGCLTPVARAGIDLAMTKLLGI
jgi:hypothetical protein